MRRILVGLAVLIAFGISLVFIAPFFISTDDLWTKVLAQMESTTGYRVRVDGPVRITLFPSLDLVASDVGIAQPAESGPAEFATARSVKFGLMLSGLLSGKVQLTEVTLIDPVVTLPLPSGTSIESAEGADTKPADGLRKLSLDELVIHNGTLVLPSSNGEPGKQITAVMLDAALPSASGPLAFDMTAAYEGKPISATGTIGSFAHFLKGGAAPVKIAVDAPEYLPAKATLAATAAYKDDVLTLAEVRAQSGEESFTGNVTYADDTLTLSQFTARYQGADVAGEATYADGAATLTKFTAKYRGFDLTGSGTYKDKILSLNPITGTFDGHTASGAVTANLAGPVPSVGAVLKAEALDLNKLLGKKTGEASRSAQGGGAAGWSDAKIDFSPLKSVNANLKLDLGQVTYDKINIGAASLTAVLAGGKLTAEIPSLKLYGGGGSASVAIDASGAVPAQRIKLSLAGLSAQPFLTDVVDFTRIEGKVAMDLNVAMSGASERAIVSTLNGTAKFAFTEGALRGINLGGMLRNLTTGILTGWQVNEEAKTAFTKLGASFKIANGQALTDDLALTGPLVSVGGAGTVDLPARTLKFRVNPLMLASVEGASGKNSRLGFPVPIAVSGPWDNPSIYPDIVGILENPVAAYQQLNKLGGGLISVPASILGIDTGDGGLVEKGVALPTAITKGVVGGIGRVLGVKKKDAAPQGGAPAAGQAPAPASVGEARPQAGAEAPPKQQATPQAAPAPKKTGPAGRMLDGLFGN